MRFEFRALVTLVSVCIAFPALAQFSPGPNPITGTVTGPQTLAGGTGTVDAGGEIRIASGSTVAVTMTGTSTLNNSGTIQTLGTGRAIDSNSGIANLTVVNRGLISSVSSDAFRVNTNSAVSLTNLGAIRVSAGGQAIDWAAISSAPNALFNLIGGTISAVGEDAVRPGANGLVENSGTISATPLITAGAVSGSDGIDLRTLSGIFVRNTDTIVGRHGIATDGSNAGPSTFALQNDWVVQGLNGSGLNIDGVSPLVTASVINERNGVIKGGVMAGAAEADGDGIDVDGVLTLSNLGSVAGLGARGGANNAEGIAAGGGSITNSFGGRIVGSTLAVDAPNGDPTRAGNGILIDDSNGGAAVAATAIGNSGLIQGKNGFAIKMVGSFSDSIDNGYTGEIRGAGTGAAIQMGDGDDRLFNRGTIVSDIGNAIDFEGGNDTLVIDAGTIVGDVSGGAGNDTVRFNLGQSFGSFSYVGVLSDFETVELLGGDVTLSGANRYAGTTSIDSGTLTLDGVQRISAASDLRIAAGTLRLANAPGANAQRFASLTLAGDAAFDLGASSLTFDSLGSVAPGSSLTVINWDAAQSPDYAFRFAGDLTASTTFLALVNGTTIDGLDSLFRFDGIYTNVSAVPLPGALLLLGSGLGLLCGMCRRRIASAS